VPTKAELVQLRAVIDGLNETIEELNKTISFQRNEIIELKKKLNEPVVLTSREDSTVETGKPVDAGQAICKMREEGHW